MTSSAIAPVIPTLIPPVRTALVGCGNIAGRHASVLSDLAETELVAVCDLEPSRAADLAGRHGCRAASDLAELLAGGEIESCVVSVPATVHAQVAGTVLEHRVAALVEKPLDLDAGRAAALVELAGSQGIPLSVVSQHRFHDDVRWLHGLLASGALGALLQADVASVWKRGQHYYDEAPGRGRHDSAEGGVLANQAVHALDLLLWLAGPARAVTAASATRTHQIAVEDTAALLVELASGAQATVRATTSGHPQRPETIELRCERGTAVLSGGRVTLELEEGLELGSEPRPSPPAGADRLRPFRRQHADFARAVRGAGEPLVRPHEALAVVRLIRAAYRSASEGRRIDLAAPLD